MYIIQMADLHIGSSKPTVPSETEIILKSAELIKAKIPKEETILICLCGDIIDSKDLGSEASVETKRRYNEAIELIENFKEELTKEGYKIVVKCCPGNHDATHMDELYNFVKKVDTNPPLKTKLQQCYTVEVEGSETKIIFVNSCKNKEFKKGCIDYTALEDELQNAQYEKKIIILHHTVMSMFEEDDSSIRNAAKLVGLIDEYNVIGVLHGHIHGREILSLGKNHCKIIGTGALFTRENSNVNSQFNIIKLKKNIFCKILNCRYNADGGDEPWNTFEMNRVDTENILVSSQFSKAYKQLMDRLDVKTPIYNMRMEIENTYEQFLADLREFFAADKFQIGDREFSYFELAEKWQAEEIPEELYFNHGSYFKIGGKSGIDFVAEQLKNKPSSNRIVLPTYNIENVNESLDDTNYLPSLVSIQFGKHGKMLIVHMHLRALEAKRFLKINICEIRYLLEKLKDRAIEFEQVKIIISAFRVQKRERFSCFLKAEIDKMDHDDLVIDVDRKKFSKLCNLFQEKKDATETITKVHGIQTVYDAMQKVNKRDAAEGKKQIYNADILETLEKVLIVYGQLDMIHKTSSISSEKEKLYEKQIVALLESIIKILEDYKEVAVS